MMDDYETRFLSKVDGHTPVKQPDNIQLGLPITIKNLYSGNFMRTKHVKDNFDTYTSATPDDGVYGLFLRDKNGNI